MKDTIKISVSEISLFYIIIYALFSRYIEHFFIWNGLLFCFFTLNFINIIKKSNDVKNMVMIFSLVGVLTLIFLSWACSDTNDYFFKNLKTIIIPLMSSIIIYNISNSPRQSIKKYSILINFLWILNIVVLAIQCQGTGFLIKKTWIESNSFYEDQCCGLFGNSGTHELCLFSAFILMYNYYLIRESSNKKEKIILSLFTCITEIYHFILSTKNDNVSVFIVILFFILDYVIINISYNYDKYLFEETFDIQGNTNKYVPQGT